MRPEEIENESFRIIDTLVDLGGLTLPQKALVRRVIHATGDPSFSSIIKWSDGAFEAGIKALSEGAAIVTDVEMARSGISKVRAGKYGSTVNCYIGDAGVADSARERGVTRSIAAVEKAVANFPEAVFVFGNAPTALFRLLELCDEGKARPKLVIGTVVGFVGAAESKEALMARDDLNWIACAGNKGGSNVAAACVNALFKAVMGEV
ncbi:precorrin-8X methylmutase [bacterium]|nr:MAG: precorrin-8X methylmutase [bacterium]